MADVLHRPPADRATDDRSTAELVQQAGEQISRLVRDELALARAELTEKGKHAGFGIGLFGGGGVLALYGLATLIAAAVLLLGQAWPPWVAALTIAVLLFALAGGLAIAGRRQVRQAAPAVPTAAADSVRADVTVVSAAMKRGRRS
ncbi:phage holin family protein [Solwaraspora sp. WMMD406]|uniref:phage holin family protein n=1 Tax=Solwaraspora sp. WMMD406 TaxID=3016095 RepID=UPI002417D286|nr:phage holin family protein [Solwaraspora sp. WMMD406]MDG4766585.1 phage holin family protein [Solwaraspora sp. WMMD406]